jgi:hypothetical protein
MEQGPRPKRNLRRGCDHGSAVVIIIEEASDPQSIWIIKFVWPDVARFGIALMVQAHFRCGRLTIFEAAKN